MSTKAYLDEIDEIKAEIKRHNERLKPLRNRLKELESHIADYIRETGQHGLRYNGKAILLRQLEKRKTKKKEDKESAAIQLLERHGVGNASTVYNQLLETQKGEIVGAQNKIKTVKIPKV